MADSILTINQITAEDLDHYTVLKLLHEVIGKTNELVGSTNGVYEILTYLLNEGLSEEVIEVLTKWLADGTLGDIITNDVLGNIDSRLDILENDKIRTPQYYGAKGDGYTDDSIALKEAIQDCANNGYVLFLNGKYRVQQSIVYEAWRPVTIIGSRGTYPSLTQEEFTRPNESFDIYFDNGAVLEIGKFGCVTFLNVGFASNSKDTGTGIIIRSFRNKFSQCSFSQMHTAIRLTPSTTGHWCGENQILYSQFSKCTYGIYSDSGTNSDSEIIGNLFHGSCNTAFYGSCPGFTISLNHFYAQVSPSVFKYFNTSIINNYIQESPAEGIDPCFILDGSFGCTVNGNKFELNPPADNRTNAKALIGIKTRSGGGNIMIDGNSVHGKSLSMVKNLALIEMLPADDGTRYDMPLNLGVNNTRCCEAIFKSPYPLYNINGALSTDSFSVAVLGGTVETYKVNLVNGVVHFYVKMDTIPNYENLFKVPNWGGIPFQYTMFQQTNSGTKVTTALSTNGVIKATNYGELNSVEVTGSYVVHHRATTNYNL